MHHRTHWQVTLTQERDHPAADVSHSPTGTVYRVRVSRAGPGRCQVSREYRAACAGTGQVISQVDRAALEKPRGCLFYDPGRTIWRSHEPRDGEPEGRPNDQSTVASATSS